LSSENEGSPYNSGDKESLGSGLYCETVIGKDKELEANLSISLGVETAKKNNIRLENIFEKADHKMYINKVRK